MRRWAREGLLPAARWGGRLHFAASTIRRFQEAAAVQVRDPTDLVRRTRRNRRIRDSADIVRRSIRAGPLRDPADLVRPPRRERTHANAAGDVEVEHGE